MFPIIIFQSLPAPGKVKFIEIQSRKLTDTSAENKEELIVQAREPGIQALSLSSLGN